MLTCINDIKSSLFRIKTMHTDLCKLKKETDLEIVNDKMVAYKDLYYGLLLNMASSFAEADFIIDDAYNNDKYSDMLIKINSSLEKELNTIDEFIDDISLYVIDPEYYNNIESHMKYFMNTFYGPYAKQYRETDSLYTNSIALSLNCDRNINILDLEPLKENMDGFKDSDIKTATYYGMNIPENLVKNLKRNYDRVALGSFSGSNVSNEVFDIALLNTPLTLSSPSENRIISRSENWYITNTHKYIRPGGYLVLIIPYFKVTKDLASKICKFYENIQVRKNLRSDIFKKCGCIMIVGKKKRLDNAEAIINNKIDKNDYKALRYCYDIESIPNILNNPVDIKLPQDELEVKNFRGSVLDVDQIKDFINSSRSLDSFFEKQFSKKVDNNQRPLLPFNTGQIGLVLTSGCLDGIVDEGNGYYHAIKGRVVKQTDSQRESNIDASQIDLTETTSNKVEINVFLPDGTYKVLA